MKKLTHIEKLFDLINGGDDVDAAAEAQEIAEELLEAAKFMLANSTMIVPGSDADVKLEQAIQKAEGR